MIYTTANGYTHRLDFVADIVGFLTECFNRSVKYGATSSPLLVLAALIKWGNFIPSFHDRSVNVAAETWASVSCVVFC